MFIKGKDYITKTMTVNFYEDYGYKEEEKVKLVIRDESGEIFTSYQLHEDIAEQVISEISNKIMTTPTSKNFVIDIEEIIKKL